MIHNRLALQILGNLDVVVKNSLQQKMPEMCTSFVAGNLTNRQKREEFVDSTPFVWSHFTDPHQEIQIISFSFFSGRALTTFDAGRALIVISSPVAGLRPTRSLVAGFVWT